MRRFGFLRLKCPRMLRSDHDELRVLGTALVNLIICVSVVVCILYLAECEYNILIVLADIVHTGVMPGSNVVLRDLWTVRSVTLVVPLEILVLLTAG